MSDEVKALTASREVFLRAWPKHRPHEPLLPEDIRSIFATLDAERAKVKALDEEIKHCRALMGLGVSSSDSEAAYLTQLADQRWQDAERRAAALEAERDARLSPLEFGSRERWHAREKNAAFARGKAEGHRRGWNDMRSAASHALAGNGPFLPIYNRLMEVPYALSPAAEQEKAGEPDSAAALSADLERVQTELDVAEARAIAAEQERDRLREKHESLKSGDWWYPADQTDRDSAAEGPWDIISDHLWMNGGESQVVALDRAVLLPTVYASVHVFTEAEKDAREDDEPWIATFYASEEEARAALQPEARDPLHLTGIGNLTGRCHRCKAPFEQGARTTIDEREWAAAPDRCNGLQPEGEETDADLPSYQDVKGILR